MAEIDNAKISSDDLIKIIQAHRTTAFGPDSNELTRERADAMDRYHGRPYGNEEEGLSQVVTRDLSETVDWIMPALMRIFLKSGNLAEFEPVGPEDEEAAEQQNDYVNHVIMKDNNGFILLHDIIKDILLLKNGYSKYWWDDSFKITERTYSDVSILEISQIMERVSQRYDEVEFKDTEEVEASLDQIDQKYNVTLKLKRKINRVKIEATPPEECRVSNSCRGSVREACDFWEHVTQKTRSQLIEMGMDKKWVYDLSASGVVGSSSGVGRSHTTTTEQRARDSVNDESNETGLPVDDRSMELVTYCETYIRVDFDRDGIAELRRVINVNDKIPEGDEWNRVVDVIQVASGVAKRVPHRHIGESLYDELEDLMKINTELTRQMINNIYHTNDIKWNISKKVNKLDLMRARVGGFNRIDTDGPVTGHMEAVQVPPIIAQILPAIDHFRAIKDNRTGINELSTNISPDVLKEANNGTMMEALERATQKVEMIARMIAETFVRELVLGVNETLIKHQDQERIVKLRGKFTPINPTEWEERTDLTVKVGIGNGSSMQKMQKFTLLSGLQEKLEAKGLVGPKEAYKLFQDMSGVLDIAMPEDYAINPESPEYKKHQMYVMGLAIQAQQQGQQQQNPLAEAEMIKGKVKLQSDQMTIQAKQQIEAMKLQHQQQVDQLNAQIDMIKNDQNIKSKEAIEVMKAEMQAWLEGVKVDLGQPGIGAGLQDGQ